MKIEKVKFGKAFAFAVLCAMLAFLSISIGCVSAESSITQQNNNNGAFSASWRTEAVDAPVADMTLPMVMFVPPTPDNNSEITVDYVLLNVSVNENVRVALLNWNGVNITMNGSGKNFYLNMTNLSNGNHTYSVYANDTAGNIGVSEARKAIVNDTAFTLPLAFSVSIISPHDDQVFKQNEVIAFNCSVLDGTHPYSFNWTSSMDGFISDEESFGKSLSVGEHVISLSASDSSGQNETASLNISVIMETKKEEAAEKEKIRSATTIVVPDDYPTIQQAVDNASDGDTIFVRSGTYPENIRIDKDLTLEGEDRDTTTIDGGKSGNCIRVSSADVNISGFTIKNAGSGNDGVYAYSSNLNLNNATISNCGDDAIRFYSGKSLTLRDSIFENCGGGLIYDYYGGSATGNATIERNIIRDNSGSGLEIRLRKSAVINDNQIINSTGTGSDGIYCSSNEVTMENNTVKNSGDDGIYLSAENAALTNTSIDTAGNDGLHAGCQNLTINPPFTIKSARRYGIFAYKLALNLNNATISNCGNDAICFRDGKSLTLRDSILENCEGGLIYDYYGKYATGNATIERNIIRDNTGSGLYIRLSSGKGAVINDNQIINSTGTSSDGIYCSSNEVTMENNTVKNSGDDGIYLSAENAALTNTSIDTASNDGLHVYCQNLTINPPFTIRNVGGYGIYTDETALNLNNATISNCGDDAIRFYSGKSLTLRDSIFENCGGGLIYDYYGGSATGNATIERNVIRDNSGSGLEIRLTSGKSAVINDNQIINSTGTSSDGIYCYISSNGSVTMENNTVKNSGDDGIYLSGAEKVTLINTIIDTAGDAGLYVSNCQNLTINLPFTIQNVGGYGIYTDETALNLNNATISDCGGDAIYFKDGKSLSLRDNILENCGGHGVSLSISSTTKNSGKLRNNVLTNNKYGFSITGTSIESYYQDIDTSNTINGKPIYYLVEEENEVFDGIPVGYLGLVSCENMKVKNLELTNNGQGVLMVNTSDSEIHFNNCSNNGDGIKLSFSSNNTLTNNTASNNSYGIYLDESSNNNTITNSNASNNSYGIYLDESSNNTITNNSASCNDYGVYLDESSNNNTITKNNAYPNRVMGFKIDASSSENRVYMNNFKGINISKVTLVLIDVIHDLIMGTATAHCGFFAEDSGIVTINVSKESDLLDTATFYVPSGGYYDFEIFTLLYYDPINPTTVVVSSPSATSTLDIVFLGQTYYVCIQPPPTSIPVPLEPVEHFLNSTEEITYTYKGNNYTNYLGNYWSNYEEEYPNATEIDSTGIWDTPYYNIYLGKDNYPLVEPWENYFAEKNQPPIANFTYSPDNPIINQLITFNASTSYDPDGTIVKYEWDFGDGNTTNTTDPITTNSYASADNYTVTLTVTDNDGETNTTTKLITVSEKLVFDTGSGTYPSIFGTHNGTINPKQTITVSKLYTYPCPGTGGHTEFSMIWNETIGDCAVAEWNGYVGDYHIIAFNKTLTLEEGMIYNYTIRTGSYPQIHHTDNRSTPAGFITCSEFMDANGKTYTDWIPAIRLE